MVETAICKRIEILADTRLLRKVTIASIDKASALADTLSPILMSHGLLLRMSNFEVIRGERF